MHALIYSQPFGTQPDVVQVTDALGDVVESQFTPAGDAPVGEVPFCAGLRGLKRKGRTIKCSGTG